MKKIFIVFWLAALLLAAHSNPLPIAELTRISAFPPEIEVVFNGLENDTLYLSEFSVYTSQGIATIDSGVYIAYNPDSSEYTIVFDSSNTSGFAINHEADSIWLDIVVFDDTVFYEYTKFGNFGDTPPPIKGRSLGKGIYCAVRNPDIGCHDCLMFDFADWEPGFSDVIINEVSVHCDWNDQCGFIELFNTSNQDISLDGYKLVCDTIYDLPGDAVIPTFGFYVIDEEVLPEAFDIDFELDNLYIIHPDIPWPFTQNRLVDQVGWSSDHGENVSFMRFPDGDVDSTYQMYDFRGYDDASSYTFENGFPTRGAPNRHDCPGFAIIGAHADSIDETTARIKWTDPIWDDTFIASMLVKSHEDFVSTPEEGEIVYTGNDQEYREEFIVPEMPYYFTVFARDYGGQYSTPTEESQAFIYFNAVGIEEEPLPEVISLLKGYPNPFNAQTTISFSLEHQSPVNISIYDITGRLVEVLTSDTYDAGSNSITWDATGQPSGIYFARLAAGETVRTSRMVLLK